MLRNTLVIILLGSTLAAGSRSYSIDRSILGRTPSQVSAPGEGASVVSHERMLMVPSDAYDQNRGDQIAVEPKMIEGPY